MKERLKKLFPVKRFEGFYYPNEVRIVFKYWLPEYDVYFRILGRTIEVAVYRDDVYPKGYYTYTVKRTTERVMFIKENAKEI
jgi:hypothetical protein